MYDVSVIHLHTARIEESNLDIVKGCVNHFLKLQTNSFMMCTSICSNSKCDVGWKEKAVYEGLKSRGVLILEGKETSDRGQLRVNKRQPGPPQWLELCRHIILKIGYLLV